VAWVGIAIVGTGVMTFRAGSVIWLMLLLTLLANFLLALSFLIAKKYLMGIQPLVLSTARTIIMTGMSGATAFISGDIVLPSFTTWLWIAGGAFLAPFLSYVFFYQALRYFELSKAEVIRATQPLFVALYGLLLFGTLISGQQFWGGLLILAGVLLMLWERRLG